MRLHAIGVGEPVENQPVDSRSTHSIWGFIVRPLARVICRNEQQLLTVENCREAAFVLSFGFASIGIVISPLSHFSFLPSSNGICLSYRLLTSPLCLFSLRLSQFCSRSPWNSARRNGIRPSRFSTISFQREFSLLHSPRVSQATRLFHFVHRLRLFKHFQSSYILTTFSVINKRRYASEGLNRLSFI